MTRHRMAHVLLIVGLLFAADRLHAQCASVAGRSLTDRQYEVTRTQLQARLERLPNDAAAIHCMGRLLLDRGEAGDAVEWLDKAVARDGHNAQYQLWLGMALRSASCCSSPVVCTY